MIVTLIRLDSFIRSSDKSWDAVGLSIWIQATLGVSLVTTCIPSLKRVLENLQCGLMAGTVSEFHELSRPEDSAVYGYGTGSKAGGSKISGRRLSAGESKAAGKRTIDDNLRPDYVSNKGHGFVNSIIGGSTNQSGASHGKLNGSSESVENLTGDGITQTIAYEVRYGDRSESYQESASSMASSETRHG